MILLEQLLLNI